MKRKLPIFDLFALNLQFKKIIEPFLLNRDKNRWCHEDVDKVSENILNLS